MIHFLLCLFYSNGHDNSNDVVNKCLNSSLWYVKGLVQMWLKRQLWVKTWANNIRWIKWWELSTWMIRSRVWTLLMAMEGGILICHIQDTRVANQGGVQDHQRQKGMTTSWWSFEENLRISLWSSVTHISKILIFFIYLSLKPLHVIKSRKSLCIQFKLSLWCIPFFSYWY